MVRTSYSYDMDAYPSTLQQEIEDSAITISVDGVEVIDGQTTVWFVDALSGGDVAILDGVVAAHDSTPPPTQYINRGVNITFVNSGDTEDKWLKTGGDGMKTSDKQPIVLVSNAVITGLIFVNEMNGANTDVEIYRSGVLLFTWEVRNKRFAYKTNGLYTLTFGPGDYLSVFVRKPSGGGTKPKNITINVSYIYTDEQFLEGGESSI